MQQMLNSVNFVEHFLVNVELIVNNLPQGEKFTRCITGIYGPPHCGKSSFAVAFGIYVAKIISYNVLYIDCNKEIKVTTLRDWDIMEGINFSYYDFRNNDWTHFSEKAAFKEKNNVIIIDPISTLADNPYTVLEFIFYFLYLHKGNVVFFVNYLLGSGKAWYSNIIENYVTYNIMVSLQERTEKDLYARFKATKTIERDTFMGNLHVYYK